MEPQRAAPLAPRLWHSRMLLGGVLEELRGSLRRGGRAGCRLEDVEFAIEAVSLISRASGRVSGVAGIPSELAPSVQAARAVSAALRRGMPGCSGMLSEASVHLGSVVLDSAAISRSRLDLGRSNDESAAMLAEAKLIACSRSGERRPIPRRRRGRAAWRGLEGAAWRASLPA